MKKILLLLLLAQIIGISAAPVSMEMAQTAAENLVLERLNGAGSVQEIIPISDDEAVLMYLINFENGFVFISGDDAAYPVFGYGMGSLLAGNLPPQLTELLEWQKSEIEMSIIRGESASGETAKAWQHFTDSEFLAMRSFREIAPLLSTNWDQGQYYNADCPLDPEGPGGHVWAGCVATAMAQVMKYYEYPVTGEGSHSYYHWEYGTQSASFGTAEYNWGSMPENVNYYNDEVAELLYHLGVSVEMDYGVDGSGAYSDDARDALVNYFLYQDTASLLNKNYYSDSVWADMIRTELDNGRPLYYRGSSGNSGHAFNLDGYQGSDHFHFNWGWSGYANGYYYLDDLTPASSSYIYNQAAIFYLEPSLNPEITVIAPNGGESFSTGETVAISWLAQDIGSNVSIILYDGNSVEDIISAQTLNDGSYLWTIPANHSTGDSYRIKIMDSFNNTVYDYSDQYFTIYDPIPGELAAVQITISSAAVYEGEEFEITISSSELEEDWNLISYQFSLLYDETLIEYTGYSGGDFVGNILAYEGTLGHVDVAYANAMPMSGTGDLVTLHFLAVEEGVCSLNIPDFRYNTYDIDNISPGSVEVWDSNPFLESVITVGEGSTSIGNTVQIAVSTSLLTEDMGAISFQFSLNYDPELLEFTDYALGEIPGPGNLLANVTAPGQVMLAYANVMPVTGEGTLCYISFSATAAGLSELELTEFKYNSFFLNENNLIDGSVEISSLQYPDWQLNPPDYEYNASIWGIVYLDGEEVVETSGMLGCFVGEECRGIASLADGSILDFTDPFGHIIFLPMVYSNQTSGEILNFRYFDANTEEVYNISESMELVADMVVGNGYDPFEFHASTISAVDIHKEIVSGWNWFSLNVEGEDMGVNSVLSSLGSSGLNIKNQSQSAIYYEGAGWFGSLNAINNTSLYKLEAEGAAALDYTGIPVDPEATAFELNSGWNWIGYTPQVSEAINYALGEMDNGMNIKNQSQSAIYYEGAGWFGSLNTLNPLAGYMLQMGNAEIFSYPLPETVLIPDEVLLRDNMRDPDWYINPPDYEFNGFIWGVVEINGQYCDDINDMIGVFVEEECRGIAAHDFNNSVVDFTDPFGHIAFMPMVYSNETYGETLSFMYYDASADELYELDQHLEWVADMTIGNGNEPYVFSVTNNSISPEEISRPAVLGCYPNPFNPRLTISFYLPESGETELSIYNLLGQKIKTLCNESLSPGNHRYVWEGESDKQVDLSSGVYFYRLESDGITEEGKILMLK